MPEWEVRFYKRKDLDEVGKEKAEVHARTVPAPANHRAARIVRAGLRQIDNEEIEILSIRQICEGESGGLSA